MQVTFVEMGIGILVVGMYVLVHLQDYSLVVCVCVFCNLLSVALDWVQITSCTALTKLLLNTKMRTPFICVCLYVCLLVQVFSAKTCLALHVECVC